MAALVAGSRLANKHLNAHHGRVPGLGRRRATETFDPKINKRPAKTHLAARKADDPRKLHRSG